jgi:hypothetical protein
MPVMILRALPFQVELLSKFKFFSKLLEMPMMQYQ